MPDFYKGDIPILDEADAPARDVLFPKDAAFGMTGRTQENGPDTMFGAAPAELKVYDPTEWDALYDEQERNESSLEHIYLRGGRPAFVNLDQNGHGYCWAYSTGSAMMLSALRDNRLDFRLNPHSVAAIIKGGRNEGGWCGLSADFVRKHGMAEEGTGPGQWPKQSRNLSNDKPAVREAMANHKSLEDWFDLTLPVYGQKMTARQLAACGFNNIPCPSDFNWWGHSVCQVRWVRIERGSWGPLILNSWLNWGRHGLAVLRGSQATADNAVGIRVAA